MSTETHTSSTRSAAAQQSVGEVSSVIVASQHDAAPRPDALDLWIAEVGEDYVANLVEATRQGVAAGTIPAFSDKESFLRHLTRSLRKPA